MLADNNGNVQIDMEVFQPRQFLEVSNQTHIHDPSLGRRLKLIWSCDTHTGDSLESYLDIGESDIKKSRRTTDATFKVTIYREKFGIWLETGSFTEHVSSIDGITEINKLTAHDFINPPDVFFTRIELDGDNIGETIKRFRREEW